jgi:uncharacterized protein (DUF433 family)
MDAALRLPDIELTPRAVSALLDVPERRVRKEIEHGIFGTPLPFSAVVYVFALGASNDMEPSVEWRRHLFDNLARSLRPGLPVPDLVEAGGFFRLDLRSVTEAVIERISAFDHWKQRRVVEDLDILAGEPVFKGSRLAVRNIGGRVAKGERTAALLEDYPYLTEKDLEFARRYAEAYPRVGRPHGPSEAPRR